MNQLNHLSKALFNLHQNGESIVVVKRNENVASAIVTGIVMDLIAFPFFAFFFLMGFWILYTTPHTAVDARGHSELLLRFLGGCLGLLFVITSAGLSWFLFTLQPLLFPYECRFKKTLNGTWSVQRKLWFLSSRWKDLGENWAIVCDPAYLRGDWGCRFWLKLDKRRIRLTAGGVFTESKKEAQVVAAKDLEVLKDCFGVQGELIRWN